MYNEHQGTRVTKRSVVRSFIFETLFIIFATIGNKSPSLSKLKKSLKKLIKYFSTDHILQTKYYTTWQYYNFLYEILSSP